MAICLWRGRSIGSRSNPHDPKNPCFPGIFWGLSEGFAGESRRMGQVCGVAGGRGMFPGNRVDRRLRAA